MADQEGYIGVLVNSSAKVSTQCFAAVKKANSMHGDIIVETEKVQKRATKMITWLDTFLMRKGYSV